MLFVRVESIHDCGFCALSFVRLQISLQTNVEEDTPPCIRFAVGGIELASARPPGAWGANDPPRSALLLRT